MRIFAILVAMVFSGCANSREDKSYSMDARVLSSIARTVSDTNRKASINQDFTEAADQYLSDVDKILLRMDETLNCMKERLERQERRMALMTLSIDNLVLPLKPFSKLRLMVLLQLHDEDIRKAALDSVLKDLKIDGR